MGRSRTVRRLLTAAALVVPLIGLAAPADAAPPQQVFVTPATGLTDFQPVQLTGTGFEPGALLEWFQCRGGAVTEADCDGYNADFIDVDGAGNVDDTIYVDARIYLPDGTEVDCRTDPAGCEVGVGFMVDAGEWPEAALDFDPTAPLLPVVTGSVDPSTDLVDGQTVQFAGEHLSFREETFVYLCATGDEDPGERCDLDHMVRVVAATDGTASGELTLHAPFDPPLGDPIDCRTPGTACEVVISWSFASPPDRQAIVPVSFRQTVTPTSSTTTAPSTTTTSTPVEPVAPPAQPVPGTSAYTG